MTEPIVRIGQAITGEVMRYRQRWGAAPPVMDDLAAARVLARKLLTRTRPAHQRLKAASSVARRTHRYHIRT
jgi:hypothetical protein